MQLINGVPVWGDPDMGAVEQINRCAEMGTSAALMADHHVGYSMPIGGVVAYENYISPSGVGYDIACGNKAVQTNLKLVDIENDLDKIMTRIQKEISFGLGRNNNDRSVSDHPLFDRPEWQDNKHVLSLKRKAGQQLGTVGSGNHYVDLLVDDLGFVWIANHFGSRGLGHNIASGFIRLASGLGWDERPPKGSNFDSMDAPPTLIKVDSELGQAYITYMNLAGEYAYAGRSYVVDQVLGILGNPDVTYTVHVHHNFAWLENGLWVVRKGATPLYPGDEAFIGASMGEPSAIVRGKTDGVVAPEGKAVTLTGDMDAIGAYQLSINSAPHGAGRIMSRSKAAGKWVKRLTPKDLSRPKLGMKKIRVRSGEGAISYEMMAEATKGIIVKGGGLDESPHVYKQLPDVLSEHSNIEVVHWLYPVGVVMASDDIIDPYKD